MISWDWIWAAVAVATAAAIAVLVRWLIRRLDRKTGTVRSTMRMMARIVFGVILGIGIYAGLRILGVDLGPVLAGAGIAGIALAFALQDIASNYISGILMGFRNPFNLGDEIVTGDYEGTAVDLNLRYTTLRQPDGVKVMIPNSQVLTNPLTNLTAFGNRRSEFTLGVAYGTSLDEAQDAVIAAVTSVPGVDNSKPVHAWVESLDASWITIRVRYWHGPRIADVWEVRNHAIKAVLNVATENNIVIPFEQHVVELKTSDDGPAE